MELSHRGPKSRAVSLQKSGQMQGSVDGVDPSVDVIEVVGKLVKVVLMTNEVDGLEEARKWDEAS